MQHPAALVGFFYFSGWKEVYQNLKENPDINIRLLVGLEVEKMVTGFVEHGNRELDLSYDDQFNNFMRSLGLAVNNKQQDTKEVYEQVGFFVEMVKEGRLVIRKTKDPNHAKLYLFEMNEKEQEKHNFQGYLITGSSNLTHSGLRGQQEFNVEIKDYGYEQAVQYFDALWKQAIPLTEIEDQKKRIVEFIENQGQTALVTPFEAYAFILKNYLDWQKQKELKPEAIELLEKNSFKKFSYQIDAAEQALSVLEQNNGVIIADVVGLGKSVIAALIAKNLNTKGVVICPPSLAGDSINKTGWEGYVDNFELYGWKVHSRGKIDSLKDKLDDIDTIIIDEAHNFRNQDTNDYESLSKICQNKKVILLTATPFNNSPADIFSLLKLFIVPGLSNITLTNDLDGTFRSYNYQYEQLSYILKNCSSTDEKKREKAEKKYITIVDDNLPINTKLVKEKTRELSNTIKRIISPVTIRRNRLDLKKDYQYKKEVGALSKVNPPQELFYKLNESQSKFYDAVVENYFNSETGKFAGAIYRPDYYKSLVDENKLDEEGNRIFQRQFNLFDFMRRLLVKRFESSFGAFANTIERFINVHEIVLEFINNTGKFILDRSLIEKIYEDDPEKIDDELERYKKNLLKDKKSKDNTVYDVNKFTLKDKFLKDIQTDIALLKSIKQRMQEEKLVDNDPKRKDICEQVKQSLENEPGRKIIIFSEYVDTVKHLKNYFIQVLGDIVLTSEGGLTKKLSESLESNFNAQYKGVQKDDYKVLITSDKLSEGVNLNRAGTIINYDIPWNPTKVIQRVGRINRIGSKVFDELNIFNFFPSETGANYVKSKEIAAQKMFMIHNSLGEDAQIFSEEEEPTASSLYTKINQDPEDTEEIQLITEVRNLYNEIKRNHPETIERIAKLPSRVKTAKKANEYNVNVLRKKGLSFFPQQATDAENGEVEDMNFDKFLQFVKSEQQTPRMDLSPNFWNVYERVKAHKEQAARSSGQLSREAKAHNNLKAALKIAPREKLKKVSNENIEFIRDTLIKDIKQYHTLSERTLGRLSNNELNRNSPIDDWQDFFNQVDFIKGFFGKDYLKKILARVENKEDEVIIAVENN